MTVAVVGLGAMGSRVARRLLGAGHDVVVWNRTRERMLRLVELGAAPAATPAEAARRANVVVTIVSDAAALRAVTEGPSGVAAGVGEMATVCEMSTVEPDAVLRLGSILPAGAGVLDAPVLGSIAEADSGSLTILVGGPAAFVERARPVLSALGILVHIGPLGAGAAAKLVANAALFGTIALLGEALALADGLGLPRETAYAVLAATPLAAQAERRRSAIEAKAYPPRFTLSLARKDADLIAQAAASSDVDLRLAAATRSWFAAAEGAGWGSRDYVAVIARIMSRKPSSRAPAQR